MGRVDASTRDRFNPSCCPRRVVRAVAFDDVLRFTMARLKAISERSEGLCGLAVRRLSLHIPFTACGG